MSTLSQAWSEHDTWMGTSIARKKVYHHHRNSIDASLSQEFRYLHQLFLALDANFRLKRRDVSGEDKDPSYSLGWAYFVPEIAYRAHLKKYESEIVQSVGICPTVPCLFSL
jgi:hypothetical protein